MKSDFEEICDLLRKWIPKGQRTLPNGTQILCPVPHVAPQAWLHKIYAALSESEITEYEKKFPLSFPSEYREFLHYANGINVFSDSFRIFGLRTSYCRIGDEAIQPYDLMGSNQERPRGCPNEWLFFGSYRWDGTRLLFDLSDPTNQNKVYRCVKKTLEILQEWPDFWEFLKSEIRRLEFLYDENGVKLDKDAPTI